MHRLRYDLAQLVWRAKLGPGRCTYSQLDTVNKYYKVLNHTTRLPCSRGTVAHHSSTHIKHTLGIMCNGLCLISRASGANCEL